MARYSAALNTLNTVYRLDHENSAAQSLQKRIEYFVSTLESDVHSGYNVQSNHGANGHKWRRSELVLIVDQDENVLIALTSVLRKYGFRTIGAGSYNEAVDAVPKHRPDMVISEVNFENGSVGYDLYLWVRMNLELQDVPFLFLATRIDRDTLIAGKRLGVTDFVIKPLDEELVVASILNCFSRKKKNGTGVF